MTYLTTGWLCVIVGSFCIAVGGFLTTKGWNEFSNHSERKKLISSAMRELEQNNKYLEDMNTAFEQLSNLDQVYLIPTFHYNVIQLIQTSSLFNEEDNSLLSVASSFLYNVNPVNDSVLKLNIVFSDTSPSLQHKKNTYASFYNSPLLERFRQKQKELHEKLLKLKKR
ncbi:MAG: hypothetical protein WC454_08445 [Phycisphaerae bacterium]|jgi:hypothetical protein